MPINHRTNFDKKKCPDDPIARKRLPSCSIGNEKPFVPQTRYPPTPSPSPHIDPKPRPPKPSPKPSPPPIQPNYNESTPPFTTVKSTSKPVEVKNMTAQEYEDSKLVKQAYQWRREYDMAMDDLEKRENNLDYDDPESLRAAKQEALKRANNVMNERLHESDPVLGRELPYSVDTELSNPDTGGVVFVNDKTGEAKLVFHGKEAGYKNLFTGEGQNRSAQGVNNLDDLSVARAALSTPFTNDHVPELYPGIDQQADSLLAKYGDDLSIVSFSNGGPKHLYLNRTKGIPGTSFDPMMGLRHSHDISVGTRAPIKILTTDNLSVSDAALGATLRTGPNVEITRVPHVKGVEKLLPNLPKYVMSNHSIEGPFDEANVADLVPARTKFSGFTGGFKDAIKATPQSLATGFASSGIQHLLDPSATGQKQLLETAGTNVALDSGVAMGVAAATRAPIIAAGGTAAASLLAPTLVGYEVADTVGKAMDNATAHWKDRTAAASAYGAATGASTGASALATYKGLSAAYNATKALTTATEVGEAGVEMTEAGVGAGVLGGETAAMEATGAAAGAEGGLNPIADAAFLGTGIVTGATAVGVGIANLFHHTDSVEERQRKTQARYTEIYDRYMKAQRAHRLDIDQFSYVPAKDVLNKDDVTFMNHVSPNWDNNTIRALKSVWQYQHDTFNNQVEEDLKAYDLQEGDKFGDGNDTLRGYLTAVQNGILAPDYVSGVLKRHDAKRLHLSDNVYNHIEVVEDVGNGLNPQDAYERHEDAVQLSRGLAEGEQMMRDLIANEEQKQADQAELALEQTHLENDSIPLAAA